MKILFLDVDGVLNFSGSAIIDPDCLARAVRIIESTGARTVFTTDWREGILKPERCSASEIKFAQRLANLSQLDIAGFTPMIAYDRRGEEIKEWLAVNAESGIESFAVVDDLDFDIPGLFPDNFVRTSGFMARGLTDEDAGRAIAILKGETACPTGNTRSG